MAVPMNRDANKGYTTDEFVYCLKKQNRKEVKNDEESVDFCSSLHCCA